jgi:hypothetical protein
VVWEGSCKQTPGLRNTKCGGTTEGTACARLTLAARGDQAKEEAPSLIEKVLRRENVYQVYSVSNHSTLSRSSFMSSGIIIFPLKISIVSGRRGNLFRYLCETRL